MHKFFDKRLVAFAKTHNKSVFVSDWLKHMCRCYCVYETTYVCVYKMLRLRNDDDDDDDDDVLLHAWHNKCF